jgi:outer membrane protein
MNFSKFATRLLGLLALLVNAHAQQPVTPASVSSQVHLVTISFTAAVMQTAEAQREFGILKARFTPRQNSLQTLSQEVEALRREISDDTVKLAEADRAAKSVSLTSKEKELRREEEDFRTDSESASQQAFQRVAQKVYSFLEEYARQHSYSKVIERGTEAAPVVWYASTETDITDAVVRAYNAWPANASSAVDPGQRNSKPQTPPLASAPKKP